MIGDNIWGFFWSSISEWKNLDEDRLNFGRDKNNVQQPTEKLGLQQLYSRLLAEMVVFPTN